MFLRDKVRISLRNLQILRPQKCLFLIVPVVKDLKCLLTFTLIGDDALTVEVVLYAR